MEPRPGLRCGNCDLQANRLVGSIGTASDAVGLDCVDARCSLLANGIAGSTSIAPNTATAFHASSSTVYAEGNMFVGGCAVSSVAGAAMTDTVATMYANTAIGQAVCPEPAMDSVGFSDAVSILRVIGNSFDAGETTSPACRGSGAIVSSDPNSVFYNNLFVGGTCGSTTAAQFATEVATLDHNGFTLASDPLVINGDLYSSAADLELAYPVFVDNVFASEPGFVEYPSLEIAPTSPFVGRGRGRGRDIDGEARAIPPSIGAYEP